MIKNWMYIFSISFYVFELLKTQHWNEREKTCSKITLKNPLEVSLHFT